MDFNRSDFFAETMEFIARLLQNAFVIAFWEKHNFNKEECLDLQRFDFENIPKNLNPPIIPALKDFIEIAKLKELPQKPMRPERYGLAF